MLINRVQCVFAHQGAKIIIALTLMMFALWMAGVQNTIQLFFRFPLYSIVLIFLFMLANLWVVSVRFWCVLRQFSYRVSFINAARATFAGYLASLVMTPLLGQVAGRQSALEDVGISPIVNSALAGYERILLFVVSALMGVIGTAYLIGQELVHGFASRIHVTEIIVLMSFSFVITLSLGGRFEVQIMRQILTLKNLLRIMEICVLTAIGQCLILLCFVSLILTLNPTTHFMSALAASAMVSFVASMPISVNGWGIRELASVFVFGKLGISPDEAVTISVLIGFTSTLVIMFGGLFIYRTKPINAVAAVGEPPIGGVQDFEKEAAWLLGISVVLMVFFQVHVILNDGIVNVNLADPFALLSLAAVTLLCLTRRRLPQWRLPEFNRILVSFSILISIGFVIGVFRYGVTQWALAGRLLGWLVLLGYLSAGYLLVASSGGRGVRRMMETLSILAIAIVVWQAINRVLTIWGYEVGNMTPNFEAYSGNRNAFAFQLLAVMALLLAYGRSASRSCTLCQTQKYVVYFQIAVAILSVGIVFTGSRAGILAGGVLLIAGLKNRSLTLDKLLKSTFLAGSIYTVFWLGGSFAPSYTGLVEHGVVQSVFSGETSNSERLNTWLYAVQLWCESPIYGAGLGGFMAQSAKWLGHPQVIHSTPLWLLAEFGIVGLACAIWSAYKVIKYAGPALFRPKRSHRSALLFLLLIFAVFSLVHEIFYQRIIWLMLGAVLALPGILDEPEVGDAR